MTWSLPLLLVVGVALLSDSAVQCQSTCPERPNIVYILADDAGWSDFESHDPYMHTPNIKRLRKDGMFLSQNYMLPMCAPSRSAFLSGQYPHTYGAQNGKAYGVSKMFWLNETLSLIPQELKKLNYTTHMIGKWHLGFCHPDLIPTSRGFDSFFGFMLGAHGSYWFHHKDLNRGPYDLWKDDEISKNHNGSYNTELFNQKAKAVIKESDPESPFFLYLAYTAPHGPHEVPEEYISQYCPNTTERSRRVLCGMMAVLDQGVGWVVRELKRKGTYNNTVIVVTSDNGGAVGGGPLNYPLRGGKKSVYEGGVRVYTVLKAPCLQHTNVNYTGMFHAVDWMPTFLDMAGGQVNNETMHGVSHWPSLKSNSNFPRTSMLYTWDDHYKFNHSAYRSGRFKLIQGKPGLNKGWYKPDYIGEDEEAPKSKYLSTDQEFYDLDTDYDERRNLIDDPEYADEIQRVVEERDAFLNKYKPQPFKESTPCYRYYKTPENHLSTCFCDVPGREQCVPPPGGGICPA